MIPSGVRTKKNEASPTGTGELVGEEGAVGVASGVVVIAAVSVVFVTVVVVVELAFLPPMVSPSLQHMLQQLQCSFIPDNSNNNSSDSSSNKGGKWVMRLATSVTPLEQIKQIIYIKKFTALEGLKNRMQPL